MFRTMLTRRAGADGTKRLLREYGARLVAVRYRYDEERGERMKTVEIAVETVKWRPKARRPGGPGNVVHVRLRRGEDLLRRALLLARCRYDEETGTWRVPIEIARGLGLTERTKGRSPRIDPKLDRTMQK